MLKKILTILAIISLWQLIYFIFPADHYVIPSPVEIGGTFYEVLMSKEIFFHTLASFSRVVVGFFIAAIVGIGLALLFGYYRTVGEYFRPIVEILRPIPPIAWIPIAILIFGLGNASAYFIVFLGAFFPIFTNTYFGVISLPKIYKNVASSFELGRFVFFRKILFKFSLPYIFTGLKIGIGMAWICVIAAELIGAQSGLGYFIQLNRLMLQTDKMLVGMILIGIIGYFLNYLISTAEKTVVKWGTK
jgi:NitT/TauT family transport system permease protein/sulfonate transport system permease protein